MVNAFVLVHTEEKRIRELARNLLEVDGVTEVYPVAGEYDFLVVIRVKDNATLSHIITEEVIHKPGVHQTKTLFALDAYAKIDLAATFGLQ
jgi:DNA-binding Lrp family transcriptional regulator